MSAECRQTELKIAPDLRLRAGMRAALEHICGQHGLTKEEQRSFAAAVEKECAKTIDGHNGMGCVVTIDEMEDRIEVSVGPSIKTNGSTGRVSENTFRPEPKNASGHAQRADAGGQKHVTLVKHLHKNIAHS